jgi:hypothetical protein
MKNVKDSERSSFTYQGGQCGNLRSLSPVFRVRVSSVDPARPAKKVTANALARSASSVGRNSPWPLVLFSQSIPTSQWSVRWRRLANPDASVVVISCGCHCDFSKQHNTYGLALRTHPSTSITIDVDFQLL